MDIFVGDLFGDGCCGLLTVWLIDRANALGGRWNRILASHGGIEYYRLTQQGEKEKRQNWETHDLEQ